MNCVLRTSLRRVLDTCRRIGGNEEIEYKRKYKEMEGSPRDWFLMK